MVNIEKTLDRDNLITEEEKKNQDKINSFIITQDFNFRSASNGSAFTKKL